MEFKDYYATLGVPKTASDKEIKDGVEAALKVNTSFENVHVDSVDNGVVLLSGKTATWDLSLLAIETADRVPGARRVSSLIETDEKGEK